MMNIEDPNAPDREGILPWVSEILRRSGVTSVTAFLSGSGDSGDIDDIVFKDAAGIPIPCDRVERSLRGVRMMTGSDLTRTGWEVFQDQIYEDAGEAGNYYDNDGGSVELDYRIEPDGLVLEGSSFTEFEPEEDDEFEDDEFEDDELEDDELEEGVPEEDPEADGTDDLDDSADEIPESDSPGPQP